MEMEVTDKIIYRLLSIKSIVIDKKSFSISIGKIIDINRSHNFFPLSISIDRYSSMIYIYY